MSHVTRLKFYLNRPHIFLTLDDKRQKVKLPIKSSLVSFSSSISHYCVWRQDIPTFSFTDETITHIRTLMTTRTLSWAPAKPFLNRNLITKNSSCLCRRQVRVEWFTELKREYISIVSVWRTIVNTLSINYQFIFTVRTPLIGTGRTEWCLHSKLLWSHSQNRGYSWAGVRWPLTLCGLGFGWSNSG